MTYLNPQSVTAPKKHWELLDVVYDLGEHDSSVAFGKWMDDPCLASRWNGSLKDVRNRKGNPISNFQPTWFVLPDFIAQSTLKELLMLHASGDKHVNHAALLRAIKALMMPKVPFEQYWLGKHIDIDQLWSNYDEGGGYIAKVERTKLHMLRLTFSGHSKHFPLFDHEAIYKTVQGSFHEIKSECLSDHAYYASAPIFLHRVDRGSGIYTFLAELSPLFPYIAALAAASMWYRSASRKDQDYDETRWKFITSNFPLATDEDYAAYLKASSTFGRRRILQRLIKQGLHRVEISKCPISTNNIADPQEMVEIMDEHDVRHESEEI